MQVLKNVFFTFTLLILFNQELCAESCIEKELKAIPYYERVCLEAFFKYSILWDCFGHVLFYDNKPVCFTGFSNHIFERNIARGWKCWKKYEALFPHPNYLIIEEPCVRHDEHYLDIFIINKKTFLACLNNNLETFKEILGDSSFLPGKFLLEIETKKVLRPLINDDDCLLGIILGYGEESASAFKKMHKDKPCRYAPITEHYQGIKIPTPKKCQIHAVPFMGDPYSEEVQGLVQIYQQELVELWSIYKGSRDILRTVLEKLCS